MLSCVGWLQTLLEQRRPSKKARETEDTEDIENIDDIEDTEVDRLQKDEGGVRD